MKDDSGPAFPFISPSGHMYQGMSLRDYFAKAALQGSISHGIPITTENGRNLIADWCYKMADAMLKERTK